MKIYDLIEYLVTNHQIEEFLKVQFGIVGIVAFPNITKDKEAMKQFINDRFSALVDLLDSDMDDEYIKNRYGV